MSTGVIGNFWKVASAPAAPTPTDAPIKVDIPARPTTNPLHDAPAVELPSWGSKAWGSGTAQWVDSKGQIRHLDAQDNQFTYAATPQTTQWRNDAQANAAQINAAAQQQGNYRGMHQPQQRADMDIHGNWQAWRADRPSIEADLQRQHMARLAQEVPLDQWQKNWLPHSSMAAYRPRMDGPIDPDIFSPRMDPMAFLPTRGPGPVLRGARGIIPQTASSRVNPASLQTNYQRFLTDRYMQRGMPDIVRRQAANPSLARNFWEKQPSVTPPIR